MSAFAGAAVAWVAFTQAVPPANELVACEGVVEEAGWSNGRRKQFVIELAKDERRFAIFDGVVKRQRAPAEMEWIGKRVHLIVATTANRFTGRTLVYSLELDGKSIYGVDDLQKSYREERPKLLGLASVLILLGTGVVVWRVLVAQRPTDEVEAPPTPAHHGGKATHR